MSPTSIRDGPSSPSEPKPAPENPGTLGSVGPVYVKAEAVGVERGVRVADSGADEDGEEAQGNGQVNGESKEDCKGSSTPTMPPPTTKDDASSPSEPKQAPESSATPGSIAPVDVETNVDVEVKESVAERGVGPSQGKRDDEDCGGFPGGPSKHSSWYSTPEMEKEWEKEWAEQCKNSRGLFAFMPPGSKGVGLTMEGGKGKGEGSGGDGKSE